MIFFTSIAIFLRDNEIVDEVFLLKSLKKVIAAISNNGGTWIDIVSTHSAVYGGGSGGFNIEW